MSVIALSAVVEQLRRSPARRRLWLGDWNRARPGGQRFTNGSDLTPLQFAELRAQQRPEPVPPVRREDGVPR